MALEPVAADRLALAEWRDEVVGDRADLRPVDSESLHLTLVFLGYRAEKDIPRIWQLVAGAARGHAVARLRPRRIRPVPPRSPRLFALDLEDEGGHAAALQAAVSGRLEAERLHRPERRGWWPHITLARVKRGTSAGALEALSEPPDPLRAAVVTLYRSLLRPQGALYVPLERLSLAEGSHDTTP
ncbi:MAG: RNA 2',3'-cyclic phosphodiesterase [Actinobacteria bacterium]|nr:RNA 2',3'-cyclic phosphodiesterase [Actinomycetota bacterium]